MGVASLNSQISKSFLFKVVLLIKMVYFRKDHYLLLELNIVRKKLQQNIHENPSYFEFAYLIRAV